MKSREENKFIGFDLGAESGRCVVAVVTDEYVKINEVHRFITHNFKDESGFHWDILSIYNEIITGLTIAREKFGTRFNGIGIDTWGVDYVLVDVDGKMLGFPFHYRDDRTDGIMEQAFKIVPPNEIYKKAGIQFVQINSLFQLLAEKQNKFDLLKSADKFLLIPDFLNFKLSGIKKAEFTIASTTSLADPHTRNWSWGLIAEFGLPKSIFPEMVEPGTILAPLLSSVAEETGLNKSTPVYATAGHDTASAVVSVPSHQDESRAFLSTGTWSLMGVELTQPVITTEAMNYNFTNEGGAEGRTTFLKNIIGLWPLQECKRYWKEKLNEFSYEELVSMAARYGFAKAWVNLENTEFLKPGDMPEKIISFLSKSNQVVNSDPGFIIRVILESLAFSYREAFIQIEKVTGKRIEKLYAVGGGIRNVLLTQLTADAINREVLAGPVEGAITGNIGVQAVAAGAVSNLKKWRKIISNSFELKIYKPVNSGYFNEHENFFKQIMTIK